MTMGENRMTKEELGILVRDGLDRADEPKPWSVESGAVLFSDISTIKPGRFYLMGMNPGGDGDHILEGENIINNLCAPDGTNAYADQCWECGATPLQGEGRLACRGSGLPKCALSRGLTPVQQRVCDLISSLGVAAEDLLSTNLVFRRSSDYGSLPKRAEWTRRCWDVHKAILKIVRPEWIIMLGFGQAYGDLLGQSLYEASPNRRIWDENSQYGYFNRVPFDIDGDEIEIGILAVIHPGNQPFNLARLGGRTTYPDEVKAFIKHL